MKDELGRFMKKKNRTLLRTNVMAITDKEKELIDQMRKSSEREEEAYLVYLSQEDLT